jgi:hypothetical protein
VCVPVRVRARVWGGGARSGPGDVVTSSVRDVVFGLDVSVDNVTTGKNLINRACDEDTEVHVTKECASHTIFNGHYASNIRWKA